MDNVDYPASKDDIFNAARDNGADQFVLDTIQKLPDDHFQTQADVSQAVGKIE